MASVVFFVFAPEISTAGKYEVRLLFTTHENRSTKTAVTIHCSDGKRTVAVNQRQSAVVDGVPRALGVFRFEVGKTSRIAVSNSGADGVRDAMLKGDARGDGPLPELLG